MRGRLGGRKGGRVGWGLSVGSNQHTDSLRLGNNFYFHYLTHFNYLTRFHCNNIIHSLSLSDTFTYIIWYFHFNHLTLSLSLSDSTGGDPHNDSLCLEITFTFIIWHTFTLIIWHVFTFTFYRTKLLIASVWAISFIICFPPLVTSFSYP